MSLKKRILSRYSMMTASGVLDEETGEAYPDILSLRYNEFEFSSTPSKLELQPHHIDKPYNLMRQRYGSPYGDDVLLDLNLVPHIEYLGTGQYLYLPTPSDFHNFIKSKSTRARKRKV